MDDMSLGSRLIHAWNAFKNRDPTPKSYDVGPGFVYRPDRPRFSRNNERSIVTALYNKIALDVANIDIVHSQLDEDDRYVETVDSGLNRCLNLEANIDQTGHAFKIDMVMSMFDEGVVAVVPTETDIDPDNGAFDILSMRTAKIIEWYPQHIKVRVYNERNSEKVDMVVAKNKVAIIENPFYSVMNEPNSTLQRLIRKLNLLDAIDEQSGSGKLDLIIQLPYVIKSQARRDQAEQRRKDIEMQLAGSKYGIAYTDGTEKITQLNRPVENNLLKQIEYLTNMLYSQLGFSQSILDGTADEKTMLNYTNRILETVITVIVAEFRRKFLTKTARTQKKSISYFRDPFKLTPVGEIAEIADKLTRNEILSSNEIRQKIGFKPSKDPKADQLVNSNLNQATEEVSPKETESSDNLEEGGDIENG